MEIESSVYVQERKILEEFRENENELINTSKKGSIVLDGAITIKLLSTL